MSDSYQEGIDNLLLFGIVGTVVAAVGCVVALVASDGAVRKDGLLAAIVGGLVAGVFLGGDSLYRRQQRNLGVPLKPYRGTALIASLMWVCGLIGLVVSVRVIAGSWLGEWAPVERSTWERVVLIGASLALMVTAYLIGPSNKPR